ncbi:MAG: ABC transporter substrate-binding protein [Thermodesulfobacteriota bacterium]
MQTRRTFGGRYHCRISTVALIFSCACVICGLVVPYGAWGAVLKVGLLDEPKTLNPFGAKDIWAAKVMLFLYQRLYYRDPVSQELVPWLASDQPVWDPQTKTVTFHLRDGKWDDGSPFTAEDVVFTAELILRFRLPAYYNNWSFVERVEALDPRTVRLTLKEPMAILWERTLTSFVVQKKRWASLVAQAEKMLQEALKIQEASGKSEQAALTAALGKPVELLTTHRVTQPESLGPFTFQEWQKGAYIHLKRNSRFFALNGEIAGRKVGPHVDGIIFKVYGNMDTAVLALKKGDVDYLWWGIESGYLADLRANPEIRIFSVLKSGYRYLAFNLRKPPMSDRAFRLAVAFLLDKDFIVERILHNEGCRLDTLVQPDNLLFCHKEIPKYGEGLSWQQRVEKARAVLHEAGYRWEVEPRGGAVAGQFEKVGKGLTLPDGKPCQPLSLMTPPADYDAQRAQTGNVLQQWLKDFGFPVNWRPMAFSAMVKKVESERDFDMYISGWGALGQDPDFLRSFFHSRADRPDGNNAVGYRNQEFDRLADLQAATMDVKQRREIVHRLQEILMDDLPYIPLYVPMNLEGVRVDKMQGWVEMVGGIGNLWSFLQVRPVKK